MKKIIYILMLIIMLSVILILTGCSSNKNKVVIYTCMEEDRNQALK